MKLSTHRYGKARVRVLKILRDGDRHTIKEIEVRALLRGDFESSYLAGDNRKVVATDTIKNTVNVFARKHLGAEIEKFALTLAEHFVANYEQVREAEVEVEERNWQPMEIDGKPHQHSFVGDAVSRRFTRVTGAAHSHVVQSGVRDLVILKSTGSGFEGYPKDEFTTLPETADRILATSFSATWTFTKQPANYRDANDAILSAMMKIFTGNYSPSAQTTLFQMGEAALGVCAEISRIDLEMPNKHCLLINLAPFGLDNPNEVFVPIDEPHGQIEASVVRDD